MKDLMFCHYCRTHRPPEGFKLIPDPTGRTKRQMCPTCQQARRKARQDAKKAPQ